MAHGRESSDWSYDREHSTVEKLLTYEKTGGFFWNNGTWEGQISSRFKVYLYIFSLCC